MKIFKSKIFIFSIIVLLLFLAASPFIFKKNNAEYSTQRVEAGDLLQTISEVGIIKPAQRLDLAFPQSGRFGKLDAAVGDKILKNQVLAELECSSVKIKQEEARANLQVTKANLEKILAGATSYEIKISQANLDKAQSSYDSAVLEYDTVVKKAEDLISQAQKAVKDLELDGEDNLTVFEQNVSTAENNLSNAKLTYQRNKENKESALFTSVNDKIAKVNSALDYIDRIVNDEDAKSVLSVKNIAYLNETNDQKAIAAVTLGKAEEAFLDAKNNNYYNNIYKMSEITTQALNESYSALKSCYSALENSMTTASFTQSELDSFKSNLSTHQTAINSGISSVETAEQNYNDAILNYNTVISEKENSLSYAKANLNDAKISAANALSGARVTGDAQIAGAKSKVDAALNQLSIAKAELSKLKSPARIEDVSLARAQTSQAKSQLEIAEKNVEDCFIKSPINGRIAKIEYEIGEQINAGSPVISVLAEDRYEVEIDISEADIAKVSVGDKAIVSLDAFGEEKKYSAAVSFIEPAQTVISDVTYYRVKIQFEDSIENLGEIKSGMTANALITTNSRTNVILAPSRAIVEKNGQGKFVRVLLDGELVEKPVQTGLRGDGAMVEILSGLTPGEEAVTYVKEKK